MRTLQIKRFDIIFSNRQIALRNLSGKSDILLDGEPLLAPYYADEEKTKIAYVYAIKVSKEDASGVSTQLFTMDTDNIEKYIGMTEDGYHSSGHYTSDASNMDEAILALDEKIYTTSASSVSGASKIVTDVIQGESQITAKTSNVTNVKLDGYAVQASGKVATSDTLGQALGKLQGSINAMDYTHNKDANEIVVEVSQGDGIIAPTYAKITTIKLRGLTSGTDAKIASGDTLGGALAKLQAQIDAMDLSHTANDNEVQINTTETDGKVSASYGLVTSRKLSGLPTTSDTKIASTDTLGTALANLQGQINAMDLSHTANENEVQVNTTEADGKVSATYSKISSIKLSGLGDTIDSKIGSTDTLGVALGKLQGQINAMDLSHTANDNEVQINTTEADGKVSASYALVTSRKLSGMPTDSTAAAIATGDTLGSALGKLQAQVNAVSGVVAAADYSHTVNDNEVQINTTQTDGKVSVSFGLITSRKLSGYAEQTASDVASTDTLGTALGKLQGQIHAMDLSTVSANGKVISSVTQTDGKVSATNGYLADVTLTNYAKDGSKGAIAATDSLTKALSKLEYGKPIQSNNGTISFTNGADYTQLDVKIESGEHVLSAATSSGGVCTNIKISATTPTETNVREQYALIGTDGTQLGSTIKIYKDSSLKNVQLGNTGDLLSGTSSQSQESTYSNIVSSSTGDTALDFVYQLGNGNYKLATVDVESFLQESEFKSGVTVDNGSHIVHGVVDPNSEKIWVDRTGTMDNILTVGDGGFKISNIGDAIKFMAESAMTDVNTAVTNSASSVSHLSIELNKSDYDGHKEFKFTTFDIASQAQMRSVMGQSGTAYTKNTSSTYISAATNMNNADIKLNDAIVGVSGAVTSEVARAKSAETAIDGAVGLAKGNNETRTWTRTTNYPGSSATVKSNMDAIDTALKTLSGKTVTKIISGDTSIVATSYTATDNTVGYELSVGKIDCGEYEGTTRIS